MKIHSEAVSVVVWELLWWERSRLSQDRHLAAQFREKGAVELGGLILVEIGRGSAGRAFVYLSIGLETAAKGRLGQKDDADQMDGIVAFRKRSRSAETRKERAGGRREEKKELVWWWW